MDLVGFDASAFLRDDWQKRPRLIRNPWTAWVNPLAPDELAGLACEDGVSARIVEQGKRRPKVSRGPFKAKRFATLGSKPWTLLVDAVDHVVPAVAALLPPFAFVPNWRIDDVMVSYASDGGGVGAHFDRYDVFLIQGLGRRRWRIGGACDAATARLPHDDLNLLADFVATGEFVLDPGDMLYLPPGIAHDGVAVGDDCMTYSVGFRAPSRSELIAHWADHLLATLDDDDRFTDPELTTSANPGEISADALARLHDLVVNRLSDRTAFARWFGAYTTAPADSDHVVGDAASLPALVGRSVIRSPASRFSFIRSGPGDVVLFVDGASFDCTGEVAAFAEAVCDARSASLNSWADSAPVHALLALLIAAGSVVLGD
jgi:50S ribosomal protein L16 3-hydroxylase